MIIIIVILLFIDSSRLVFSTGLHKFILKPGTLFYLVSRNWIWSYCTAVPTLTFAWYQLHIVCRCLFDIWYLWYTGLGKGWKNLIWLTMWAIFAILQQALQSSTLLHTNLALKGSSISHARYLMCYSFPVYVFSAFYNASVLPLFEGLLQCTPSL